MLKPGTIVRERFEIVRELSTGGQAIVYLCRDRETPGHGRQIERALKVLRPERASASAHERLVREYKIALQLQERSEAVTPVRVYDFLQEFPGILMEYCPDAETLWDLRIGAPDGLLPVPQALSIVRQVAEDLPRIHGCNVIHRDLSPRNILVQADGRVRLIDFGIAKAPIHEDYGSPITSLTDRLYTRGYGAPEQRVWPEHVKRSADVFALGVVTFELLHGHRPFSDAHWNRLHPSDDDMVWLVEARAPRAACIAIQQAITPVPARRPTAAEFASAIAEALDALRTTDPSSGSAHLPDEPELVAAPRMAAAPASSSAPPRPGDAQADNSRAGNARPGSAEEVFASRRRRRAPARARRTSNHKAEFVVLGLVLGSLAVLLLAPRDAQVPVAAERPDGPPALDSRGTSGWVVPNEGPSEGRPGPGSAPTRGPIEDRPGPGSTIDGAMDSGAPPLTTLDWPGGRPAQGSLPASVTVLEDRPGGLDPSNEPPSRIAVLSYREGDSAQPEALDEMLASAESRATTLSYSRPPSRLDHWLVARTEGGVPYLYYRYGEYLGKWEHDRWISPACSPAIELVSVQGGSMRPIPAECLDAEWLRFDLRTLAEQRERTVALNLRLLGGSSRFYGQHGAGRSRSTGLDYGAAPEVFCRFWSNDIHLRLRSGTGGPSISFVRSTTPPDWFSSLQPADAAYQHFVEYCPGDLSRIGRGH